MQNTYLLDWKDIISTTEKVNLLIKKITTKPIVSIFACRSHEGLA